MLRIRLEWKIHQEKPNLSNKHTPVAEYLDNENIHKIAKPEKVHDSAAIYMSRSWRQKWQNEVMAKFIYDGRITGMSPFASTGAQHSVSVSNAQTTEAKVKKIL